MLETKIEKLTKAIEALTVVIEAQQSKVDPFLIPPSNSTLDENTKVMCEQVIEECHKLHADSVAENPTLPSTTTHEEVKDLCLKISRADRSKKPAIKALLGEYGANVVTQVATESLAELKTKLEGLA